MSNDVNLHSYTISLHQSSQLQQSSQLHSYTILLQQSSQLWVLRVNVREQVDGSFIMLITTMNTDHKRYHYKYKRTNHSKIVQYIQQLQTRLQKKRNSLWNLSVNSFNRCANGWIESLNNPSNSFKIWYAKHNNTCALIQIIRSEQGVFQRVRVYAFTSTL